MFGTKANNQSGSTGFLHKLHTNQPVGFDTVDRHDHEIKLVTSKLLK
jgi:hypothetical protein